MNAKYPGEVRMASPKNRIGILLLSATSLCSGPVLAADTIPPAVKAAVADPGRPPWERARDKSQNPEQVLAFAGAKPGSVMVDLMPDAGYYTRILSKLTGPKGTVYSYVPFTNVARSVERRGPVVKDAGQNIPLSRVELAYAIENVPQYENVSVLWESITQYGGQFGLPRQADLVLSEGDYHKFHGKEFAGTDMVGVNRAIFAALKPGGVYLVIDHAAAPGAGFTFADTLHRSEAEAVKAEVLAAGFTFDGESKAASLASDNHSQPAVEDGTQAADEFVLRFRKPLTAVGDKRPGPHAMDGLFGNTTALNPGARGKVTNERERRHFYHPDGTYEEFGAPDTGNNPWQMGTWFWDAAGHNCMIHQYPYDQRGEVVCHDLPPFKKVGEKWERGSDGQSDRHQNVEQLMPGYQRFE